MVRQADNRFEVDSQTGFYPFNMGSKNEAVVQSQAVKPNFKMTTEIPFTLEENIQINGKDITLTLGSSAWQVYLDGALVLDSVWGESAAGVEGVLTFTNNTAVVNGKKSAIIDGGLGGSHTLTVTISGSGENPSNIRLVHNLPVDGEVEFPAEPLEYSEASASGDNAGAILLLIPIIIIAALAVVAVAAAVVYVVKSKKK